MASSSFQPSRIGLGSISGAFLPAGRIWKYRCEETCCDGAADPAEDRAGDDDRAGLERLERVLVLAQVQRVGEVVLEARDLLAGVLELQRAAGGVGGRPRRVGEQALLDQRGCTDCVCVPASGLTGSDSGAAGLDGSEDALEWALLATLAAVLAAVLAAGLICWPAEAGAVGVACTTGAASSWAMSRAVILTGLGTGYFVAIEPELGVGVDVAGRVLELDVVAELARCRRP